MQQGEGRGAKNPAPAAAGVSGAARGAGASPAAGRARGAPPENFNAGFSVGFLESRQHLPLVVHVCSRERAEGQ